MILQPHPVSNPAPVVKSDATFSFTWINSRAIRFCLARPKDSVCRGKAQAGRRSQRATWCPPAVLNRQAKNSG